MGIYYIIVILFVILSCRLRHKSDATICLASSQTVCINGICILLVFVAHLGHLLLQPLGYEMSSWLDNTYLRIHRTCGQLIVVPFLFYSGYGVATQMMNRPGYLAGFLRNRALTLWLNFLIALMIYLLATVLFVGPVRVVDILKSMVFLHSFGNPTWFLFCTMVAYMVAWLAFKLLQKRSWISTVCMAGMLLYIGIVSRFRPIYWYDTSLMFPIGVIVALYKDEVLSLFSKRYWICAVAFSLAFVIVYKLPLLQFGRYGFCFRTNLLGVLLMSIVMLLTIRIRIENTPLEWLGKHVFPIYMYHMLFFFFAKRFLHTNQGGGAHLLVISIFLITLMIAELYRFWRIDASRVKEAKQL